MVLFVVPLAQVPLHVCIRGLRIRQKRTARACNTTGRLQPACRSMARHRQHAIGASPLHANATTGMHRASSFQIITIPLPSRAKRTATRTANLHAESPNRMWGKCRGTATAGVCASDSGSLGFTVVHAGLQVRPWQGLRLRNHQGFQHKRQRGNCSRQA